MNGGFKFSNFRNEYGLISIILMAIVIPAMFWEGASTYLHRKSLVRDNIAIEAVVQKRIFKHCYGIRCLYPEYFTGDIVSSEYADFKSGCGKHCWQYLQYRFIWNFQTYIINESVEFKKFEKTPIGSRLDIYVDRDDPAQSQMIETSANDGAYAGPLVLGVVWFVIGFIVLSLYLAKKTKQTYNFGNGD